MVHRQSWFVHLMALLASYTLAVHAGPITTESVLSVAEDQSAVPDEFPDDYSMSLEQAVVDRQEFAKAALLQTLTTMMEEILEEKKDRREMMETMQDLQRRLTVQEKVVETLELRNRQSDDTHPGSRLDVPGPRSCRDWQLAGHSRDGLYPIQGKQEMEIVYCSFSKDVGKN